MFESIKRKENEINPVKVVDYLQNIGSVFHIISLADTIRAGGEHASITLNEKPLALLIRGITSIREQIRAPLANQLINEFMTEVDWPEVDYLVVDLPPGTGDIQLTMAQQLPNANIVFVTTPQTVALADVYKGIKMFQEPELNIPVIGIIENMSYFIGDDGKKYEIFGQAMDFGRLQTQPRQCNNQNISFSPIFE